VRGDDKERFYSFPFASFRPQTSWPPAALVALWVLCVLVLQSLTPSGTAVLISVVAIMQATKLGGRLGPLLAVAVGLSFEAASVIATRSFDPGELLSSASARAAFAAQ